MMKKKVLKVLTVMIGTLILSSCGSEKETAMENVIPDGCEFTVAETGELFESGEPFPEVIQSGDILFDFEAGYRYAYAAVPKIDSYLVDDGAEIIHYFEPQENLDGWSVCVYDSEIESCGELRSEINGIPVVNMDYCYYGCEKVKDFSEIPDFIVSMKSAFGRCFLLEEMPELPEGLINMSMAFEQCKFTEISNIPTTVKNMSFAFVDCKNLESAGDIPDGVENMQGSFNGCRALKTVGVIPESVMDLSYCFTGCESLTGDLFIYANPEKYEGCFLGTEEMIFVYGNDNSDWQLLGKICKTVKGGQYKNVVMPG